MLQKPSAACIGIQADADFRHGHHGGFGDDGVAGGVGQAHAAAHHDACCPTDDGLGIAAEVFAQIVFGGKEGMHMRVGRGCVGSIDHALSEFAYVAACAKRLVIRAIEPHHRHAVIVFPCFQLRAQR